MAKGMKTGGRIAGKPNKASSARIERAVREGRRLPHEAMFLIGENLLARAAQYQPKLTQEDGTKVDNPEYDEDRYTRLMCSACDAFSKAASTLSLPVLNRRRAW
jgi:hypothetical protein